MESIVNKKLPKNKYLTGEFSWKHFTIFILLHAFLGILFWTGISKQELIVCVCLYLLQGFGITAGYHRYFAHKTYKTSRVMQFILAFIGGMAGQRGAISWASKHRHHHKYPDKPEDLHTPIRGFLYSHCGWIFYKAKEKEILKNSGDLMRFKELKFLDKHPWLPPLFVASICYCFGAWNMVLAGYLLSAILVLHITLCINSLAHVFGSRRYETEDNSRNNWLLAIFAMGEGWHNNHHYYPGSARQGFYWWEYDLSYYILKLMNLMGLIWDLQGVPERVKASGK